VTVSGFYSGYLLVHNDHPQTDYLKQLPFHYFIHEPPTWAGLSRDSLYLLHVALAGAAGLGREDPVSRW
jgi:hypothetical protein